MIKSKIELINKISKIELSKWGWEEPGFSHYFSQEPNDWLWFIMENEIFKLSFGGTYIIIINRI